jgi:tripartite-type tricarboxylate transporter receptor subunit TctC
MKRPHTAAIVLIPLFTWLATGAASAQTYPTKPVRMIVPFPPGGATDLLACAVGQKLGEGLGHQVVVDNRPGAGGRTRAVNRAPACGM